MGKHPKSRKRGSVVTKRYEICVILIHFIKILMEMIRKTVRCYFADFFSINPGGVTLQISKIISAKKLQGKGLNTKTSQELRMLSRSLTDCKLLLLTVMMQVSQFVSYSQQCHLVTKSLSI